MYIIESFIKGKTGNDELCEDMIVASDKFAAVIDGATNIWGTDINGKTPGRFAAETIKRSIEGIKDGTIRMEQLIHQLNMDLREAYKKEGILEKLLENQTLAPTASVVVYSHHRREVWQISDCQVLIDGVLHSHEKEIDVITAQARSLYLEAELKKGATVESIMEDDTAWNYIKPLIQQQYFLQNDNTSQYGYEVVNGFDFSISMPKKTESPPETKEIVLASDGYPFLEPTLEESEKRLEALLETDPLCIREFKCAKGLRTGNVSFDDRAYVRIGLDKGRAL